MQLALISEPEKFKLKDIYISFFNSNFNKYLLQ